MKKTLILCFFLLLIQTACPMPANNPYNPVNSSNPPNQNPVQTKQTIINKTFPVSAQGYQDFSFTSNGNFNLTGEFSATGGKNDINCIVVDDFEFANLNNQTAFKSFYTSDYVTRGRVDIRLGAGTYHIVFDNRKALITNKTVTAKFETE